MTCGHSASGSDQPPRVCMSCKGSRSVVAYVGLEDRLFGASGSWSVRRCLEPTCGLMWLDPAPDQGALTAAYERYYTHSVPAMGAGQADRIRQRIIGAYLVSRFGYPRSQSQGWPAWCWVVAHLWPGGTDEAAVSALFLRAPRRPSRLLDVGCGSGASLRQMERLGWEVEGVETDPVAVEAARGLGLTVHHGELQTLALPEESFDAVYLGHVIEHAADPVGLLRACRRVLRPGGTLVILTPNSGALGHRLFGRDWRGLEPPRHLHVFGSSALRRILQQAHFDEIEVRSTARGARSILGLSGSLRRARIVGSPPDQRTCAIRGFALIGQIIERAAATLGLDYGEELLCVAR